MPQLSPNPNRAAEECLADFHGQIPTPQERARAAEAFDKKVLVAAHMAALHDAYILEMGFHAGVEAGVGAGACLCTYPCAVSEVEREVFMSGVKRVASLRDLKAGKVHRRKVVQGSLCARSLKLVRDAMTVLEDEQGNAVSLHVRHPGLVNPEFGTTAVQRLYPLGSVVAIREPYLTRMPDGTVALLVENPALLAFLSVPPPETATTGDGTHSLQKKLIRAQSKEKGKGNTAAANGTLAQKEKEKGSNVAMDGGTLAQQKENASAVTASKTLAPKEKVKGNAAMADRTPAQQKENADIAIANEIVARKEKEKEKASVAFVDGTLALQEKEKANTAMANRTLTRQETEKANVAIADETLVQEEKEEPNAVIANKGDLAIADGTLTQQVKEKANMAMADITLAQNEEKVYMVIANQTLALREKEKANTTTADGILAQQEKEKDDAATADKTLVQKEKEKTNAAIVNQTIAQQEKEKAEMATGDRTLTQQEKEKATAAIADKNLAQKEKDIANVTIANVTLTQQEKEKANTAMAVGTLEQQGKEKANAVVANKTLAKKKKEKSNMAIADRTIVQQVKEKAVTAIVDGVLAQQEEEANTGMADGTLANQEKEKANVAMVDGTLDNQEKKKANITIANGSPAQQKMKKANTATVDGALAHNEKEKANMAVADGTLVHQKEKANAAVADGNPKPKSVGNSTPKVEEKAQKCSSTVLDSNGSHADGNQNKEKEKVMEDHIKDRKEANRSITSTNRDFDMQEEIIVERTLSPTDLRLKGNQSFVKEDWNVALQCYSDCIKKAHSENDENELVLGLSNRAELWLKLSKYEEALRDAEKALQVKPGHVKSLFRKGRALLGLRQSNEALPLLVEVQKIAPLDKDLQEVLAKCRSLVHGKQSKPSQKKRASFAYRNSFKSSVQCA